MFPHLPLEQAPVLIDGAQQRSKPSFVAKGLMLGEFHALNTTTGLRCPIGSAFCPLQTPLPALAIRSLVSSDIVFLDRPSFAPEIRASFLQSYYSRFPKESAPSSLSASTPIDDPRPSSPTLQSLLLSRPSTSTPKSSLTAYFFLLFICLLSAYCWLRSHLVFAL